MKKALFAMALPGLAFGAALTVPAAPGFSQPVEEEIIITGRYRRNVPSDADHASMSVGYGDLDLSTDWGRKELKHRINLTARYLCEKLGENDTTASTPDCRQAATRDALDRVGTIEAHFAPRGTAWVRPRAWEAPYPVDYASRYPTDDY